MKKKLLVLGGFEQHKIVIEKAKEKGLYVIVADYLLNSPGKKIADESYDISITDVDMLVSLINEKKIDGVMNYCIDPGQKPYQKICEKTGLYCYGSEEQFEILTNKDKFYEECIKNDIKVIPKFQIDDFNDISQYKKIQYPVIVKPADGRSSKGIFVCLDENDLYQSIPKSLSYSTRKKIIIEKYMERANEVCAKYFVSDGEVFLTSFSDTYTYYDGKDRICINGKLFPSKYYDIYLKMTDQKVRKFIKNIGIKNGPLSFTGFVDEEDILFFDPSYRLGGAQQWRVEEYVSGVDVSSCMTNFAISGNMGDNEKIKELDKCFNGTYGAEIFFLGKLGKIGDIIGLTEALLVDSVIGFYQPHKKGDIIERYGTTDHSVLVFLLVSDSLKKLKKDLSELKKKIEILDDYGNNMMYPNFDERIL